MRVQRSKVGKLSSATTKGGPIYQNHSMSVITSVPSAQHNAHLAHRTELLPSNREAVLRIPGAVLPCPPE